METLIPVGPNQLSVNGCVYTRHDEGETPYWTDPHGFWAGGHFSDYLEREHTKYHIRVGFKACAEPDGHRFCRRPEGHDGRHAFV